MNKSSRVYTVALMAFAILGLSSCVDVLLWMISPTMTVVDARTGTGIPNATVTLTPIITEDGSTTAFTTTSSSSGSVVFDDQVPYGTYTVSAARSGYVFIPFEATVAGWSKDLGKLFGVTTSKGSDPNAVSIFLTWAENNQDFDAHFTYPDGFEGSGTARGPWSAENAYYALDDIRTHVYYDNDQKLGNHFASLDVDDESGGGPETITLMGYNTGTASGSTATINSGSAFIGSVLPAGTYSWMGSGEYYLDAPLNPTLDNQNVRVVITQGGSIKGIFTLPSNMPQKTISLFRVQLFYNESGDTYYMVFMPDYRLVENNIAAIRSLGGIPSDTTFVISGSK